ncbi:hypothetical protein Glove_59g33 [Diversispora epigaea]|uniref:Uncharacterized protein n=1 Tax=Diversispora epigaea TaxID=1348612 RepID=A0A397JC10_9GLOM|nr:hypothetical protein Glove_59g33 [Diversispora epigaea]
MFNLSSLETGLKNVMFTYTLYYTIIRQQMVQEKKEKGSQEEIEATEINVKSSIIETFSENESEDNENEEISSQSSDKMDAT